MSTSKRPRGLLDSDPDIMSGRDLSPGTSQSLSNKPSRLKHANVEYFTTYATAGGLILLALGAMQLAKNPLVHSSGFITGQKLLFSGSAMVLMAGVLALAVRNLKEYVKNNNEIVSATQNKKAREASGIFRVGSTMTLLAAAGFALGGAYNAIMGNKSISQTLAGQSMHIAAILALISLGAAACAWMSDVHIKASETPSSDEEQFSTPGTTNTSTPGTPESTPRMETVKKWGSFFAPSSPGPVLALAGTGLMAAGFLAKMYLPLIIAGAVFTAAGFVVDTAQIAKEAHAAKNNVKATGNAIIAAGTVGTVAAGGVVLAQGSLPTSMNMPIQALLAMASMILVGIIVAVVGDMSRNTQDPSSATTRSGSAIYYNKMGSDS